ncbi:TIGR04206 family protein [Halobellus litoreus]|uniref:TIGR04206 family protein n=1 Tax=Halobellus litoreus TaxID=755310 RepID=A0ABD6DT68_9EURY
MSSPGSDAGGDVGADGRDARGDDAGTDESGTPGAADTDARVEARFARVAPGAHSTVGTVLLLLALLFVPWSVQVFSGRDATFVFAWGLLNTNPPSVTTLYEFLFVYTRGLPEYILAWPLSTVLYGGALVSAVSGWLVGWEDPRVTGGLLAVAAVAQLQLAWGFSLQPTRTAWPVGALALLSVAWWCYWPAVRASFDPED